MWRPIIHSVMCQEGRSFGDLLGAPCAVFLRSPFPLSRAVFHVCITGKFTSSQSMNMFSSRESEGISRARLLQRISFAVFAAPVDHYLTHLTQIQERLGFFFFASLLFSCCATQQSECPRCHQSTAFAAHTQVARRPCRSKCSSHCVC